MIKKERFKEKKNIRGMILDLSLKLPNGKKGSDPNKPKGEKND